MNMTKHPIVSIVKATEITASIDLAVQLAGGLPIRAGDHVVIKPNAKNQSPSGYGIITDIRVVERLIELSLRYNPEKVTIAEGAAYPTGAYDTFAAYDAIGLTKIAKKWGVDLVDLNDYRSVEVPIHKGLVLDWIRVGKCVRDADVVINVPVLKSHLQTLLSACIKNMSIGCATREEKKRIHRLGIDEGIVDVYPVVKPHFNVVDAIVALEGDGPNLPPGRANPLNLIIAGADGLAVDVVCAKLIGVNPQQVRHLQLAEQQGLGSLDLEEITIIGEQLDDVIQPFLLPSTFVT
jgi:uncharacterized protein (DUF362 family)